MQQPIVNVQRSTAVENQFCKLILKSKLSIQLCYIFESQS